MKQWMQTTFAIMAGASMILINGCGTDTVPVVTPATTFTHVYAAAKNYSTDSNDNTVETDAIAGLSLANGLASPTLTISGPADGIDSTTEEYTRVRIISVAADGSGSVYALIQIRTREDDDTVVPAFSDNQSSYGIVKFAAASGTLASFTPESIASANLLASDSIRRVRPTYLGLDSAGNFYVAGTRGVVVFAKAQMGTNDAEPTVTLTGRHARSDNGVAFVDAAGNLYTTPYDRRNDTDEIAVYAAGFESGASPTSTFELDHSIYIEGLWVDSTGKSFITDYNEETDAPTVDVVASGSTGSVTAAQSITGASTGLINPTGIAVDSTGAIFVQDVVQTSQPQVVTHTHDVQANPANQPDEPVTLKILKFAAAATGNVAPTSTFTTTANNIYSFSIK